MPAELLAELEADGLLDPARSESLRAELAARAGARQLEWGATVVTQGELLAAFAAHCAEELDDVEVVSRAPAELVVRWRDETSRFLVAERLPRDRAAARRAAVDGARRPRAPRRTASSRRIVADRPSARRSPSATSAAWSASARVRSSAFVYFEWFLRDAYGVKLLPAAAFTQGLIDRGVISLGMG